MDSTQPFNAEQFFSGLDAIFSAHEASTKAEPYLLQALHDAQSSNDQAGQLTVLNETMGFYRSRGRHEDNQHLAQQALELGRSMHIEGSEAWTTTLINAATALRAAQRYDQSKAIYTQALESAEQTFPKNDPRLAALHNNISILDSETDDFAGASSELEQSLRILSAATPAPNISIDTASTHTNLALVLIEQAHNSPREEQQQLLSKAFSHASTALDIYRTEHLEHSAHYASALAGFAQACFATGDLQQAANSYRQALQVIETCYGKNTDYYRTTAANLDAVEDTIALAEETAAAPVDTSPATARPESAQPATADIRGLELSRAYWKAYGKPMLERYPQYRGRIAAGLVGHGSECYGFDDAQSQDHDFGPGFCLWLEHDDYQAIGAQLQADYDALPTEFMGFSHKQQTARAQGAGRRVGVFDIGDFFASITGFQQAPQADKPHEWLLLDEPTLAAATNGAVFADPLGTFSRTRQGFKLMPEDVRLSLISRRLGMMAQAGQYNVPRMIKRGDVQAAWLSLNEFVNSACSLVFLINEPASAGYLPYYKWRFRAMRQLSSRMGARLPGICELLETLIQTCGAAWFPTPSTDLTDPQPDAPSDSARRPTTHHDGQLQLQDQLQDRLQRTIETICSLVVQELLDEGLTESHEQFLEWQRPYVEAHISSNDPTLHSI